jgi:hypothetical protein
MRYLLDVNALIAFGVTGHQFYQRVVDWAASERTSIFLTSPVTEIGFVRVVANVPAYAMNVTLAKTILTAIKANPDFPLIFLPDAIEISYLPEWVKSSAQITDGHLSQLAKAHGALLATLDKGIPGSFLIP